MNQLSSNAMVRGRYLIVQMIGYSDVSEVYLAVDQGSGSAVALKRTGFAGDTTRGETLEREAKVLADLRHPVLPKVIDNFVEGREHFLVIEHISGDDLAKRLEDTRKAFPLSWCMFWADQLLDALTYLHSHSPAIIHRAISPSNIKLTNENHVVLLDYGAVKPGDSEVATSHVAVSHFAPIEQIQGSVLGPGSDVYSISAAFYQLLTNVVPVDAAVRADASIRGFTDPLILLAYVNPEISVEISNVIHKGMEIDRENRFASAAEMQKALRRAYIQTKEATTAETVAFTAEAAPTVPNIERAAARTATQIYADQDAVETNMDEPESVTQTRMGVLDTNAGAATDQAEIRTEAFSEGEVSSPGYETMPAADQADTNAGVDAGGHRESVAAAPIPQHFPVNAQPQAKRSSFKAVMLIGGLIVFFVFAAAAAGGGWYVYSNYYGSTRVELAPDPTPSPVASPAPTVEVAAETDTNSNTEDEKADDRNSSDDSSNQRTATATTPGTTRSTPQDRTKDKPPRTPQPQAPKPTPKPKSGDDRTVILQ